MKLLKYGRHFRVGKTKIIVGRNEKENNEIMKLKQKTDYLFEVPNVGSPITLLQGPKTKKMIKLAAELTARYSSAKVEPLLVKYGPKLNKEIEVRKAEDKDISKIRI